MCGGGGNVPAPPLPSWYTRDQLLGAPRSAQEEYKRETAKRRTAREEQMRAVESATIEQPRSTWRIWLSIIMAILSVALFAALAYEELRRMEWL